MKELLIGRRAVYTRVTKQWDDSRCESVETDRKLFHGTIVALITTGESHSPKVVMLWDSGTLGAFDITDVTVENASGEGALR